MAAAAIKRCIFLMLVPFRVIARSCNLLPDRILVSPLPIARCTEPEPYNPPPVSRDRYRASRKFPSDRQKRPGLTSILGSCGAGYLPGLGVDCRQAAHPIARYALSDRSE